LIEDGRVIFRSPECSTLAERVAEIFGRQTAESLVPIECAEPGLRLSGLIGRPGVGRATRHEMIVFVNARPVDSRTLNYALIESYHESMPKGRYPVAFVFFECDPAAVDVNVHPAKREVRFRSESQVRGFVIRAVLQRLRELTTPAVPAVPAAPAAVGGPGWPRAGAGGEATPSPAGEKPTAPTGLLPVLPLSPTALGPARAITHHVPTQVPVPDRPPSVPPPKAAAPAWRFVGLAHGSYVLFETASGVVLLDRRAAHERVWFERLRDQFRAGAVPSQRLLLPVPVELDTIASALLLDRLKFLETHGFEIAEFGRNFFRVEAVPAWMEPADAEPFLRDLIGAFREGVIPDRNTDLAREELARLAVAKAVRLPEGASETEMKSLVAQLFATSAPLTSPSGRPVYIELNHGELARRFQK
jgi:DNA mismatch repair protein MutL